MKILLLEDDTILAESLQEFLELEGFMVDAAKSAEEVYDLTYKNAYDLYIFDINLPKDSGFEVLKNLQNANDTTPTIFISALVDIASITQGFKLGACDYIKKPFDPMELVIRIKRNYQREELLKYKDISYNPNSKEIIKNGKSITLGNIQLEIFDKLIKNINTTVESFELLELFESQNGNALRVTVSKLKSKLDLNIKNVRGRGYKLEEV